MEDAEGQGLRLSPRISALKNIVSYQLMLFLNIAVGVLTFPFIFLLLGPKSWSEIAVAQSLGMIFSIFIGWGWSATGPATVANLGDQGSQLLFARATIARIWLLIVSAPVMVSATIFLSPNSWVISLLWVLNSVVTWVFPQWYFVGKGMTGKLFWLIVLPTNVSNLFSLLILAITQSVTWYSATQLSTSIAVLIVSSIIVLAGFRHTARFGVGAFVRYLRMGWHGVINSAFTASYLYLPVVLVQLFAPNSSPSFALADKLLRYARSFLSTLTQWAQSYVPGGGVAGREGRKRKVLLVSIASGPLVSLAYFVLAPVVTDFLSGGSVQAKYAVVLPFAVSLAFQIIVQVGSLAVLAADGKTRLVARISVWSFLLNLLAAVALIGNGFDVALAWGLASGELAGCVILFRALARRAGTKTLK